MVVNVTYRPRMSAADAAELVCVEMQELYGQIRTPAIDAWNADRLSGGPPCHFEEWVQSRRLASSLVWQSDAHWVHVRKYGNKRFEKGRRRHR